MDRPGMWADSVVVQDGRLPSGSSFSNFILVHIWNISKAVLTELSANFISSEGADD